VSEDAEKCLLVKASISPEIPIKISGSLQLLRDFSVSSVAYAY